MQLTKFDYRLANNLDEDLQKLRCRVNYHALRFTKPIRELGQRLVMKIRSMANRFIAVHLRFLIPLVNEIIPSCLHFQPDCSFPRQSGAIYKHGKCIVVL